MKVGISLGTIKASLWEQATLEADKLGFESVWIPEHVVIPVHMTGSPFHPSDHPPIPANVPVFDVFGYLNFLAGKTERIRFGTQVFNIGLRHPFSVARAVVTLDILSKGRFEFGIGASWLHEEWEALELNFATRGRRVDESIALCQRLWTESTVEHHGEFFSFEPVMFEPKPFQKPWPKLHIGGDSAAALRRAALLGDGWIPMSHTLEQIPAAASQIAKLRAAASRPGEIEITMNVRDLSLENLKRHADAGVERVLINPKLPEEPVIDGLKRFANETLRIIQDD